MKKTAEDIEREYAEWLLEQVIAYGINNPVSHKKVVGKTFGKNTMMMGKAVGFMHVRFRADKTTQFTNNAIRFLEARINYGRDTERD